MTDNQTCQHCGTTLAPGSNFCSHCGKPLNETMQCPHCGNTVDRANFCSSCGRDMRDGPVEPVVRETVWARGEEDFAVSISSGMMNEAFKEGIEVRHGAKALFFEDGRLVEEAESGRYTTQEGGFLSRLFKKERKSISAVLVDAGDVALHFDMVDLKTRDKLFVDTGVDVVVRLEDPNSFFVNVMKDRAVYKIHDLRKALYGEIQNALQEGVNRYDFNDLNSNIATKNELASRMEAHLRQTFSRSGIGFGQVRAFFVMHEALDALARKRADDEVKVQEIKGGAEGERKIGEAEASAEDVRRDVKHTRIKGAREDVAIDVEEKDVQLARKKGLGDKDIEDRFLDAAFIEKRLDVYKKLKQTDVEKIKTEEEFRKFRLEVDRENVLDDAEWAEFKEEILWKGEDRQRDRRFLVKKVDLQQEYDLKRLALVNRKDLTLEEKRGELEILNLELEGALARELKREEGMAKIDQAKVRSEVSASEIKRLGEKEIEAKEQLKDLELEKRRIQQAIELETDKERARHEIRKLETDEKRLKSDLGISNLERMKAIKKKEKDDDLLRDLEAEQTRLEYALKAEGERHKRILEERRQELTHEKDRIEAMKGLTIEQLIAVSGQGQASILGDLAQSQTLKGMSSEEILAMKDPAALASALEERARTTGNNDLKSLYERMLGQAQDAAERVSQAYREGADRAERMNRDALGAMGGRQQGLVEAERMAADRLERFGGRALDRMGDAAGAKQGGPGGGSGGPAVKVQVCPTCKREVSADKNFCPNCGAKLY